MAVQPLNTHAVGIKKIVQSKNFKILRDLIGNVRSQNIMFSNIIISFTKEAN